MMPFFDSVIFGNSLRQWGVAAGVGLATFFLLHLLLRVVRGRAAVLAARTATEWEDMIVLALGRTHPLFIPILSLSAAVGSLQIPSWARKWVQIAAAMSLLLQIGLWLSAGFTGWLRRYATRRLESDQSAATTIVALGFVFRLVLWSVILLLALDNLGIDVTALVAGLGVGGIAIALAVQNILGDLFASLSIVLDKPFVVGDFVILDEHMGTVERIGLKTTRVRSLWGEQLVFSNNDLLQSRLRNLGRMVDRRVVFSIGVTYQTPRDRLEKIPGMIRAAVEEQGKTRFDRSHFKSYGDFALLFETVYYVLSREYNDYMDIQQAINLRLHEMFESERIEFAYPTQTLFLAGAAVSGAAGDPAPPEATV
ncbi:MAG TPA: mechanosensitive ion channel family protein [Gemmatimonadaceae bacterium]|nr:mechanosensitive ion channel family protein [Gemmatimonadaceae bacterium]